MATEESASTEKGKHHFGLTTRILIGMTLGIIVGVAINQFAASALDASARELLDKWVINGLFQVGGQVFMRGLMLLVVPIVFVSLVCGTGALEDVKRLGRVGTKIFIYYVLSTVAAITLAVILAMLLRPGEGIQRPSDLAYVAREAPSFVSVLLNIIPTNPVASLAEGNMLQIILFALLFGMALTLSGAAGKRVLSVFQDLNEVILKLIGMVMLAAPYGVFFLVAKTFASTGYAAIKPLALYFGLVLVALFIHGFVFYGLCLKLLGGLNPIIFFKKMREVWLVAFGTSSSNATLPVTLAVTEFKLGVPNRIASFTIPLGATVNMDGTAIMQGVATVFIAQVFGVELHWQQCLTVIISATLASIGTAGVPGVGLVMLAMVLTSVGLPVEGIAMIMGIDRLLDMTRTCVNVTGDCVFSCIVARSEKELDVKVYNET
ncbi:MAG: dicarboxylate/amino acid:cation symporter [Verrucomicrobiota bacterium]|nr:dicarboxylate/amino acid:cation symporter [Verrucomicrobiota bacterium]